MKQSKAERDLLNALNSGVSPFALMNSLLAEAERRKAQMTPEERAERAARQEQRRQEEIRRACITRGICPVCRKKLIRGKKDKKNNYKRIWSCPTCNSNHSL